MTNRQNLKNILTYAMSKAKVNQGLRKGISEGGGSMVENFKQVIENWKQYREGKNSTAWEDLKMICAMSGTADIVDKFKDSDYTYNSQYWKFLTGIDFDLWLDEFCLYPVNIDVVTYETDWLQLNKQDV